MHRGDSSGWMAATLKRFSALKVSNSGRSFQPLPILRVGHGGEEVFGYAAQMREELSLLGSMSLDAFVSNAVSTVYLPQLTWDPAGATWRAR